MNIDSNDDRQPGGGDLKDALRAFAEAADEEFIAILEAIVAERKLSYPRGDELFD